MAKKNHKGYVSEENVVFLVNRAIDLAQDIVDYLKAREVTKIMAALPDKEAESEEEETGDAESK